MNVYDIYEDDSGQQHLVKSGFCWPGLFFAWIWTAVCGMPWIALAQFATWFIFVSVGLSLWFNLYWLFELKVFSDMSAINPYVLRGWAVACWSCALIVHIYVGIFCNNWIRSKWGNLHWKRVCNVMAESKEKALRKVSLSE